MDFVCSSVFQEQNNKKDADSGNEFVSAVAWRPVGIYSLYLIINTQKYSTEV